MKKLIRLLLMIATTTLCGCVYHQAFEQGNILTLSKVKTIHAGMTSQQVVAKLGSPVLKNMYTGNRMYYVYTQQPTRHQTVVKKLVVEFHNNVVTNLRTEL